MKLRNKLIPILSAASVAATIAPATLTSCASGMVDLINGYAPSIKKAVWEDYQSNREDMLSFYASAVNENPEIFAQDMYWFYATSEWFYADYCAYYYYEAIDISKLEAQVSNVEVKKLTCFYTDESEKRVSVDYYTISFDFVIHKAYTGNDDSDYFEDDETITLNVKNVPFSVNDDSVYGIEWFDDTWSNYTWYKQYCFYNGYLPTDWVLRPLAWIDNSGSELEVEHTAFTLLEQNGYDWFIKLNRNETWLDKPYSTNEPETWTENMNFVFDHDSQFDKAAEDYKAEKYDSLELYLMRAISTWFLPSYYLSDIADINDQIHSEE